MPFLSRFKSLFSFLGVVTLIFLAGAFCATGVAQAQGLSSPSEESAATESNGSGGASDAKVALVMDASGSMLDDDAGGVRIDVAKKASQDVVDSMPDNAQLGLIAYGMNESNAPENRDKGCQDIETLAPVGKIDRNNLHSKIDGITAQGYTPIGNSLRKAAAELGNGGQRSVVLVSDGIDTCAPPAVCDVAKQLAQDGVGLTIHTVGFKVDEEAEKELQCIAKASGGQYLSADDSGSLSDSMKALAKRSVSGYRVSGTPFDYADNPDDALWLGEGRYRTVVDTKKVGDKRQYFKVAVPEGHSATISLDAIPRRGNDGKNAGEIFFNIDDITNDSSPDCKKGGPPLGGGRRTSGTAFDAVEAVVATIDGTDQGSCDMSEWVVPNDITQEQHAAYDTVFSDEVDVEVIINFEPVSSQSEVAGYPKGDRGSDRDENPIPIDNPQRIAGGSSYGTATEIGAGSFADSLVPGEYRYYKFPVEYGQRPKVTVKSGPSKRNESDSIRAHLYSPFRRNLADTSLSVWEDSDEGTAGLDRPIHYRNREENSEGAELANAGFYYIGISFNTGQDSGIDQPIELALAIDGEPEAGPSWRPTDKDGPLPSRHAPGKPEPTARADKTSENQAKEVDTQNTASESLWDKAQTPIIGVGVVVAIAALAAAVFALRSKK